MLAIAFVGKLQWERCMQSPAHWCGAHGDGTILLTQAGALIGFSSLIALPAILFLET